MYEALFVCLINIQDQFTFAYMNVIYIKKIEYDQRQFLSNSNRIHEQFLMYTVVGRFDATINFLK
jgi:hypothetical protein